MKINTIVAEYNPFHKGHRYHIAKSIEKTGADYTIVIMSGNFVQRGEPALLNKFTRARMALENGADLCLELPTYYAISSAEYFATGAVTLADKLGVVTNLCFGTECEDLTPLTEAAQILAEEPESFKAYLSREMKNGASFPVARKNALFSYCPKLAEYEKDLETPNNILGLEYLKALSRRESRIRPVNIKRNGGDYNDTSFTENAFCSAAALRKAFQEGNTSLTTDHMPENTLSSLQEALDNNMLVYNKDFSSLLHYKLLNEQALGYTDYLDVSPDLSDRIRNNLYEFTDFDSFVDLLKSKELTRTRISRCLLHILLDIKKYQMADYYKQDFISYARILGFRKESTELLSAISEKATIPLLSKPADAKNILSANAYAMLMDEVRISDIYQSVLSQKSQKKMAHEFRTPLVII